MLSRQVATLAGIHPAFGMNLSARESAIGTTPEAFCSSRLVWRMTTSVQGPRPNAGSYLELTNQTLEIPSSETS